MKKILYIAAMLGIMGATQLFCMAKSTLTNVDTVVYMSQKEFTLQQVLQNVAVSAEAEELAGKTFYVADGATQTYIALDPYQGYAAANIGGLHDIINKKSILE